MNRLVCLTLLILFASVAEAQVELSVEGGGFFNTVEESNTLSPIVRSQMSYEKAWTVKGPFFINTDLDLESFLSKQQKIFSFDGNLSLDYDLTSEKCTANDEGYSLGIYISPAILSDSLFFKDENFYSTTLGADAKIKIGVVDIKIYASPLELLNINGQYQSHFCLDMKTKIIIGLDGNIRDNTPMLNPTENYDINDQLVLDLGLFQRRLPSVLYQYEINNKIYNYQKLTYLDASLKYQHKIPTQPIKVNVCLGLQTSTGNIAANLTDADINYYCTVGAAFLFKTKKH